MQKIAACTIACHAVCIAEMFETCPFPVTNFVRLIPKHETRACKPTMTKPFGTTYGGRRPFKTPALNLTSRRMTSSSRTLTSHCDSSNSSSNKPLEKCVKVSESQIELRSKYVWRKREQESAWKRASRARQLLVGSSLQQFFVDEETAQTLDSKVD